MKTARTVVEDCDVIELSPSISDFQLNVAYEGDPPRFGYTRCNYGGERRWLLCPTCSRRVAKLYRPSPRQAFACRRCHDLTYRSSQQHDARLDRLIKGSLEELDQAVRSRDNKRALLGIKATFIRAGMLEKYEPR